MQCAAPFLARARADPSHADAVWFLARRSPAADPATRTVHFELDVADPDRRIPVHTTAELVIEVSVNESVLEFRSVTSSSLPEVASMRYRVPSLVVSV